MNKEELLNEITKLESRKSYGLVWEDKPEDVVEQCKTQIPILTEVKKYFIEKDLDKPTNLLIEGDNYHALATLNYTHRKQIDIIYIDPPYNTGAKDWKYNNDYVDENDSFRHSKWLSMMNHRLRLSRNLLTDEGALICAIDHNEQEALGVMLDELFPEREKVCVTIIHNPGGIQGNNFSYTHEYAYFVFPKNGTYISKVIRDDVKPTPLRDWGGEESKRESARNCFYPIHVDKEMNVTGFGDVLPENKHPKSAVLKEKDGSMVIYPIDSDGVERKWRFARHTVESIEDELRCEIVNGEPSIRRYKQKYRWKTVWNDSKYNANVHGTQYLAGIIKEKFPYPKSIFTVEDCIKAIIHDKQTATVLDFFAGSGTTGHAVLKLNEEDGGNRRFILCTNNENKIAEEVTYPRVKNVIKGYGDVEGIPANLRYYKTDFVDVESVHSVSDQKKIELTYKAGRMIALREDTLEETEKNDWWQIFTDKKGKTTAIYFKEDKEKLDDLVKKISKSESAVLYIFSWGKNEYKNEFTGHKNIRVEDIPEPILEVYKEINKK
ncbi:MAG: site-specific DNA-methyltransferase [Candidatus Paceibacterota bacterium]